MALRRKKEVDYSAGLLTALKDLCAEKEISPDTLFDAIESALIFACKKNSSAEKNVVVDLDRLSGTFHIYEVREVVEEVTNKAKEISLEDAHAINLDYQIGDVVRKEIPPGNFGRIAAQAAKQFVVQKIREAERGIIYDEYTSQENEIVTGGVIRIEDENVIVDIGKAEAVLKPEEKIKGDKFKIGGKVKAYVAEVRRTNKGPQITLSRTHPGFLKKLFESQVPEIQEGIITIKSVAREAGSRSKIAVISSDENIEAVGSCVGPRGSRINGFVKELKGEKIDVVQWSQEIGVFIANALSPSKVLKVYVNDLERTSRVIVPDDQLSLAIGKEGQNARLAARLTGWKIDIKSESQVKNDAIDTTMREVDISESTAFQAAG